jgi:hypothetical protein
MTTWLLAVLGGTPENPPANPALITQEGQAELTQLIDASTLVATGDQSLVWRPGGVAGGNIFTTWATLAAAIHAINGKRTVVVDTSLGVATVPAGTWDVDCTTFVAGFPSLVAIITFAEGAHWTAETLELVRIVTETAGSTNVWAPPAAAYLTMTTARLQNTANAAPFLHALTSVVTIAMDVGSGLGSNPQAAVNAAASLQVVALGGSQVNAGAIVQGDAPGGVLVLEYDGASMAQVSSAQVPAPSLSNFDPRPTFVFKPGAGGVQASNVYTTWAGLAADVAKVPGPRTILVDPSLAPCHMTAGGPYDLDNVTFRVNEGSLDFTLHIDTGASFTSSSITLSGITVSCDAAATPWTPTAFAALSMENGATLSSSAGHAPFMAITAAGSFSQVLCPAAVAIGDGATNVFTVAVGQELDIFVGGPQFQGGGSGLNAHACGGLGTVHCIIDDSAVVALPQDVATFTQILSSKATQCAFTPTTGAQWNPVPTQVGAALDQLAAPNPVQTTAVVGSGGHTVSVTTGNIAKKKSGVVHVSGDCSGATAAADTITCTLLRDAAVLRTKTIVTTAGQLNYDVAMSFEDVLPDLANHTYSIQLAGAQNNTVAANGGYCGARELN